MYKHVQKSVSFHLVWWWYISHSVSAAISVLSYQLYPLEFFVCSSLPLDSDIFTGFHFLLFMRAVFSLLTIFHLLFIALERAMKGVADASH